MSFLYPITSTSVAQVINDWLALALKPENVKLEFREWRWVAHLPGERIAFIPETIEAAQRLARERAVLQALANRVSFAIPHPEFFDPDTLIDVRRKVPGLTGRHLHAEALAKLEFGGALAMAMGKMLAELHCALPRAEGVRLGLGSPEWPLPVEKMRRSLRGLVDTELEATMYRVLDLYEATIVPEGDLVLIHGDFGSHNFAFDPESHRLCGLFDFDGVALADRHLDLKYLPSYGEAIMAKTLAVYRQQTAVEISIERIRLYHAAAAMSFLAWRVDEPQAHDNRSGRTFEQAVAWVREAVNAVSSFRSGLLGLLTNAIEFPRFSHRETIGKGLTMDFRYLLVQQDAGICRLTLNRPERLNALNVRVGVELLQALDDCDRDDAVRVVILTGAGRAFCAGDDLRGMSEPGEPDRRYRDPVKQYVKGEGRWPLIVARMRSLSKPVIGMINGHAHGAGFNLALGCDLRVMADTATLCIPFVKRGIATGTSLLQQFVGIGKAMEWALLAPQLSAQEAERWGLVNRVVPFAQLEEATLGLARALAQGPTLIYGYTKSAVVHGWEAAPETAYEYQGQALYYAQQTEDFTEGRRAFLEKRPPRFRGR